MAEKVSAPRAPSESSIRQNCGAKVWERGLALVDGHNLKDLTRAGNELFAQCLGSYGEPYQLHVRLENGAATQLNCSCPFDGGGWCKHIVALFLRYVQTPDDFRETDSLAAMIGALERDDLNAFVENLMRREPQLLAELTQLYNVRKLSEASGSADFRANLRAALSGSGADEGRVVLQFAVNEATRLETKKEWVGAGEIWLALLEELVVALPRFEESYHEDEFFGYDKWGDVIETEIDVGQEWAEIASAGLNRVLEQKSLALETRATILRTLWQCWQGTEDSEHLELPEAALDHVYDEAGAELWAEMEAFLLERLQSSNNDFEREHTLGSLAYGWEQRGQSARANHMLRESGSYGQRLELLLKEKDWDAAEKLALENETAYDPSLLSVAQWFEKAEQIAAAQRLARRARELASSYTLAPIIEWLTRFYLRHQNARDAQTEAAALFVARPDAESLELWKQTLAPNESWDELYPQLEALPAMTTLLRVRLALLDKRAARALELFNSLNDKETAPVAADVARLCQSEFPREAIAIYQQLGEATIATREVSEPRAVYKRVARYWKSARELHEKLGTTDDWEGYIGAKREEYKRFRALLDELKQAGL